MYGPRPIMIGLLCVAALGAQEKKDTTVFRTETKIVPVDVIVTDKKQNYVHDLEAKDFKVWEDGKEQPIKSFSFEADPASPLATQQKYIVLFFDNSSMAIGDQAQARQAAIKFIDANAGPNRLMAVANFGGSLQIAQNFTDDIERLKRVVNGVKVASISTAEAAPTGRNGLPRLGAEAQFGARSVLLALRNLAKSMEEVPGRKTLVMLSAGFPLTPELLSEITAAIAACNKANIAIYPIDVRGLTTLPFAPTRGAVSVPLHELAYAGIAMAGSPVIRIASFLAAPQRGGGGGGGGAAGGGAAGGAAGGGAPAGGGGGAPAGGGGARGGGGGIGGASMGSPTGNTGANSNGGGVFRGNSPAGNNSGGFGGNNPNGNYGNTRGGGVSPVDPNRNNPLNRPREVLMPHIPESALTNQQVLYRLAEGTGGFVIMNTNDLVGGLQKIVKEQSEYYLLSYSAPESPEGSCHEIKVKVNRGGMNVRSRPGYCNVKSKDALAGKPAERKLETRVNSPDAGTIPTPPMQAAFTFTASNTARINFAMEIPTKDLKFEKVKGKQHAEITVLGVAYRPGGDVAARFSDAVNFDFEDKKEVEKFTAKPYNYQNQFEIGSGQYTLKVAFSSGGDAFGKQEQALEVPPYEPGQYGMSQIVISREAKRFGGDLSLDAELMEGRTPLVAGTVQFDPAGSRRFKTTDKPVLYVEVYEPLAAATATDAPEPVRLGGQLQIFDRATGQLKLDSGPLQFTNLIRPGNSVVPVGLKIPVEQLAAGGYRMELVTLDSAHKAAKQTAEFDVQ